jgi:hypothetical protein
VLLTFVVLQQLRLDPAESVAAVKERWQLGITRQGEPLPSPLTPAQLTSGRPRKSCYMSRHPASSARPSSRRSTAERSS